MCFAVEKIKRLQARLVLLSNLKQRVKTSGTFVSRGPPLLSVHLDYSSRGLEYPKRNGVMHISFPLLQVRHRKVLWYGVRNDQY